MPPKKQQQSQKTKANKQAKAAADKTFGLKNKNKSSKVQNYVKQVEAQTKNAGAEAKRRQAEAERRAAEKKAAEKARAEAAELFKPVAQVQKVPFGVDPKSVVCIFFKQGNCTKGNKCKFSHNLDVERKSQKKDLYSDERKTKEADSMDDWDEEKLRSVVLSKHGNPKTTTDKVCKYFIEAVENRKYGWFWVCPNGGDQCKYKHSLPPGFKLKTKEELRAEREAEASRPKITLEDFIETERLKLPKNLTPVTLETFNKWKQDRQSKKEAEKELEKKKATKSKILSGKELLQSGKYTEDEDDDGSDAWNLEDLRRRTDEVDNGDDEGESSADGTVDGSSEN
uniref:ARAD1C12276p n=1 Tax=Blastobotrys adeninivorans TaxID=409370 RepID=A0A060T697_BLAAD